MEQHSLYLFIDFESIHRETLWRILRHYGIPSKIVNIVRMLYSDCQDQVICGNKLTEPFIIQTGVKQECQLSPFLFSFCIDWVMKNATKDKKGIPWTLFQVLSDRDFADDICLLPNATETCRP